MIHVLLYDYVEDMENRRAPVRSAHLEHVRTAHEGGSLKLAGALTDPVDRALFVFDVESRQAIEAFVAADPYVAAGLVPRWEIRPWAVVVGSL